MKLRYINELDQRLKILLWEGEVLMNKRIILLLIVGSALLYSKTEVLSDVTCGIEKRSLAEITSIVELSIKQRDTFIVKNRQNINEVTNKFKIFGINKIEIVSNDVIFKNNSGITINSFGGYNLKTGTIYLKETIANGNLRDFNQILLEKVSEIIIVNNAGIGNNNYRVRALSIAFAENISKKIKDKDNVSLPENKKMSVTLDTNEITIDGEDICK